MNETSPKRDSGFRQSRPGGAHARSRANIALAKYWGKCDSGLNLPAVPSISITLDPLVTETTVEFHPDIDTDVLVLDGERAGETELKRAGALLDRVRHLAGITLPARIESRNRFPTASGLASSASGFAALAAAATRAAGIEIDLRAVSALARRSSASAARSVFGGFVELGTAEPGDDTLAARPLAPADHWDVCMVIAVTTEGAKAVASTDAMNLTRRDSPFYESWIREAPRLAEEIRRGVLDRDLPRVGAAMEKSMLSMHACAMAASPSLLYWQPATVAVLHRVRAMREGDGIEVWATVDAGPHVKALCHRGEASIVEEGLKAVPGVLRTIVARPGPAVEVT
jgi:diphosphomevalonate decarboxylase